MTRRDEGLLPPPPPCALPWPCLGPLGPPVGASSRGGRATAWGWGCGWGLGATTTQRQKHLRDLLCAERLQLRLLLLQHLRIPRESIGIGGGVTWRTQINGCMCSPDEATASDRAGARGGTCSSNAGSPAALQRPPAPSGRGRSFVGSPPDLRRGSDTRCDRRHATQLYPRQRVSAQQVETSGTPPRTPHRNISNARASERRATVPEQARHVRRTTCHAATAAPGLQPRGSTGLALVPCAQPGPPWRPFISGRRTSARVRAAQR